MKCIFSINIHIFSWINTLFLDKITICAIIFLKKKEDNEINTLICNNNNALFLDKKSNLSNYFSKKTYINEKNIIYTKLKVFFL